MVTFKPCAIFLFRTQYILNYCLYHPASWHINNMHFALLAYKKCIPTAHRGVDPKILATYAGTIKVDLGNRVQLNCFHGTFIEC